ncbi:MAG: caspase family protein, partial [Bacteroidota bacterium]
MPQPINNRSQLLGFPKSYAFVVGINNYPKINAHLKSAVNDARALAIVLKQQQGFDHVELLLDPHPEEDREALQEGLDGVQLKWSADGATFRDMLSRIQDPTQAPTINPEDCIVFYYAGHGKPGAFEEGPRGYLLPSDAQPEMAMLKNESLIAMEAVFAALKKLDCHHTLLILDCCFAGKFRYADDSRMGRIEMSNMPLYPERFERYKREKAWQVLVSAGPNQTAADWLGERQELANGLHSPFAEALLEALDGKAELIDSGKSHGDGVLTAQELFFYLWNKVEQLTKDGHLGDKSQYPDLFPMANHQGGQFIFFDPHNKLNFANRELRNPYQGLSPFNPEVSDLFFGRTAIVKVMLERVLQNNLLLVTAPSGSGKSSVVKAGLYPALCNWVNASGQKEWTDTDLLVLRPGTAPWTGQTTAQNTENKVENIQYFTGLVPLIEQLDKSKKQVLLLDQYEELFTDGASEDEVTAFENKLIELYQTAAANQLKIIITLRSDYEWLLEQSVFGQSFWKQEEYNRFLYRLRAMRIDELREALVGPALAEMYEFETDKLVDSILAEVGYAPGALPMLSFLMSQYYEVTNKDERVFTAATYKKLGGINGALSKYADQVYNTLSEEKQAIMERLMIRMVKISDGNFLRRRVYVSESSYFNYDRKRTFINEFNYPGTQNEAVNEVLKLLEKKQLILAGRDRIGHYYEPVHDALLQHWTSAKKWLADFGTDNLQLQRQLWQDVLDSKQSDSPMKAGDAYGATIEDDLKVDRSLTDNFSQTWAANPKLLQIIGQVSYAAKPMMLREKDAIIAEALPVIAKEDRATFKKFWDDCYDKKKIPDLNSLILTGYSDKLLAIFLKRGNHWLNQAEADFIVASW